MATWGFDIEVVPGAVLTVRDHDPETAKAACLDYRNSRRGVRAIADLHGLPPATLRHWLDNIGWLRSRGESQKRRRAYDRKKLHEAQRGRDERILHLYHDRELTLRQVGVVMDLPYTTVQNVVARHSQARSPKKAQIVRHHSTKRPVALERRKLIADVGRACRQADIRKEKGLDYPLRKEIAEDFGLHPCTLSKYERDPLNPYRIDPETIAGKENAALRWAA